MRYQHAIALWCTFVSLPVFSVLGFTAASAATTAPPIVYTIAGSDSGGGAGIQADLHAIHSFGCHGCSAITCLTAQNSVAVTRVHSPPADFLQAQLDALQSDLPPTAVKIGMLGSKDLVLQVSDFIRSLKKENPGLWVVFDPVMISTSGHRLIEADAQEAMVEHLFPLASVLTPNKFEAEALLNRKLETVKDVEVAARDLLALGVSSVLIKGGHSIEEDSSDPSSTLRFAQDYFLSNEASAKEPRLCDGSDGVWLRSPRYDTEHTHGTGCTLSSSIASALALGERERHLESSRRGAVSSISMVDACSLGKAYVTQGIHAGVQLGQGPGPVVHTNFPNAAQHYPTIARDPTSLEDTKSAFKPLKVFSGEDDEETLGRILPIVDNVEWIERLCKTPGVTDLQLRVKGEKDPARILKQVQQAQDVCKTAGVRLWINDHWEAAQAAGCYGVHVGQEDLHRLCANEKDLETIKGMAFGISTHSYGELSAALGLRPSYVSLGPVFATSSKKVQFDPQGLTTVTKWRELIPAEIPLVCIGGIGDAATARKVQKAGADCVAVIGAVTQASDTTQAVQELNEAMSTT